MKRLKTKLIRINQELYYSLAAANRFDESIGETLIRLLGKRYMRLLKEQTNKINADKTRVVE